MCMREDVGVTRIARPIGNAFDVVSSGAEHVSRAAPDASVEQDFHVQRLLRAGSMRS